MTRSEKVQVFLRVGIVHAAAGMTRGLVALVQFKMLLLEERRARDHGQVLVAFPDASLSPIGPETVHRDAHRNAGVAFAAMRAVDEIAAAPETETHETGILATVERLTRVEKQRSRGASWQITARVRHREKNFRRFVRTRHGLAGGCLSVSIAGSASKRQRPECSGC